MSGRGQSLLLGLAVLVLFGHPLAAQDLRFFSIGTGGVAGTYYPVGGLIADVISNPPGSRPCDRGGSCGVPNLVSIANSSEGSVANVNAIASGSIDSGFAQSDVAFAAYSGTGFFEGRPIEELRLITSLYVEHAHVVAKTADSISALRGQRVALDEVGSGTIFAARSILDAHGIEESDIEPFYVKPSRSVRLMRDDELDAFVIVAGAPTSSVEEAIRDHDARILPLEEPAIATIVAEYPYFSESAIPADTYTQQGEPLPSIGVVAQWLTSAEKSEELIYEITKALWHPNGRLLLDNGHFRARSITLETALDGAAVPLHPGAERFYREEGLIP